MMRRASAWGWLSCAISPNCTVAASRWRAMSAPVPSSLCACHSFKSELRIKMSKPHVLIVDDEKSIRLALETGLSLDGFSVSSARSGREAISAARAHKFDVVVCDIFMPDGDGLDFVRELRAYDSHLPVILITAQGSLELAMQAVTDCQTDFIAKPFEVVALAELLRRSINARREAGAAEAETDALLNDFSQSGLVGRSPAMVTVYKLIAHAARSDATILITGESG